MRAGRIRTDRFWAICTPAAGAEDGPGGTRLRFPWPALLGPVFARLNSGNGAYHSPIPSCGRVRVTDCCQGALMAALRR